VGWSEAVISLGVATRSSGHKECPVRDVLHLANKRAKAETNEYENNYEES